MQCPRLFERFGLLEPDDVVPPFAEQHVEPGVCVDVKEGEHETGHGRITVLGGRGDLDRVLFELDLGLAKILEPKDASLRSGPRQNVEVAIGIEIHWMGVDRNGDPCQHVLLP